jgi:hypothetical protein
MVMKTRILEDKDLEKTISKFDIKLVLCVDFLLTMCNEQTKDKLNIFL